MKFHYLSWRTSNFSFLLQFLGKQLNVRVCPRKIKLIDRIVATGSFNVEDRTELRIDFVSSRYFHRVESICRFHRHRPSQCAPRTDFKGNRIRGVRKLLPKRLSLFTGNVLTSSRKTALLSRHRFSRESYVVRPWSPQTAHRRSRSSTDRLPGSRVKFRYLLPLTGVQLGLADSRVSSCIKRQIDSRTDDRSSILSKALINPGHSGGLLRVFSITCLICLLLVFPLFFRLSQAKC